ncbi:MAG: homocysteine S-methyltransferase family protein [Actinomycetota bacterium]|nr:homocysteine S-methyltransferase family protein [Actinomycetota bacterium]
MDATTPQASRLTQLQGRPFVTDGGIETDLIFHHGVDMPHFAAFPLLEDAEGRTLLEDYYDGYAAIAGNAGAGLMLEAPTWRANSDWGDLLGYSAESLAGVNRSAIEMLFQLRERYGETIPEVIVGGIIGPRGDGYRPDSLMDAPEAADYHHPQIKAFAEACADLVTALTMTNVGEALGIVQAARDVGLPVAISFTVETDGTLPTGPSLAEAINEVDEAGGPEYFLINCAHPDHVEHALAPSGPWLERIMGIRFNASTKSHAELDEALDLDEGNPELLAAAYGRLKPLLPKVSVVGGCCGTDARHVASLWGVGGTDGVR